MKPSRPAGQPALLLEQVSAPEGSLPRRDGRSDEASAGGRHPRTGEARTRKGASAAVLTSGAGAQGGTQGEAADRAAQRPLGSKGVSATHPLDSAHLRRRDRFNLRGKLWEMSTLRSVRGCGRNLRFGLTAEDGVGVKRGEDSAGYSRLSTCGSPWACPRCSAVISVQRAEQIASALDFNSAAGGSAYFLTLTMRHDREHGLQELWDSLQSGWRAVFGSPEYRGAPGRRKKDGTRGPDRIGEKERFGILGTLRTVEATHGENGWHLHIHAIMFMQDDPFECEEQEQSYADALFRRWSKGVTSAGLPAPLREHGIDFRRIADGGEQFLADYLTKNSADSSAPSETLTPSMQAGLEAAAGQITKKGRKGGRVPFQILRDAIEEDNLNPVKDRYHWYKPSGWDEMDLDDGKAWVCTNPSSEDCGTVREVNRKTGTVFSIPSGDFALWHEWEQASRGRRQILWSQRIKDPETERDLRWNALLDARGDEADSTDESLADREIDGIDIAGIDYGDWFTRMTRKPSLLYDLLETVEAVSPSQSEDAALRWADRHGISMWGEGVDPDVFITSAPPDDPSSADVP